MQEKIEWGTIAAFGAGGWGWGVLNEEGTPRSPHHAHVVEILTGLVHSRARTGPSLKAILKRQLDSDGWYTSTRFKVESRGTDDGYRGVLDLICWPPPHPDPRGPHHKPNPHIANRPPPILVEFDKRQVYFRTRAKLASFAYPATARIVVLTRAPSCDPLPGIDTIICLGV